MKRSFYHRVHRVATAAFCRIHSVMRVKSVLAGEGGGCTPPLITFTLTSKVAVYAPAEWADTLTLFLLYGYQYMYSVVSTTTQCTVLWTTFPPPLFWQHRLMKNPPASAQLANRSRTPKIRQLTVPDSSAISEQQSHFAIPWSTCIDVLRTSRTIKYIGPSDVI